MFDAEVCCLVATRVEDWQRWVLLEAWGPQVCTHGSFPRQLYPFPSNFPSFSAIVFRMAKRRVTVVTFFWEKKSLYKDATYTCLRFLFWFLAWTKPLPTGQRLTLLSIFNFILEFDDIFEFLWFAVTQLTWSRIPHQHQVRLHIDWVNVEWGSTSTESTQNEEIFVLRFPRWLIWCGRISYRFFVTR